MDKSKWEYKKLTDVCSILYGYPFDSKCFNDNEQGRPLIRIRDVVRGFTETYTTEKCPDEYIISEGDLLIGMDGEFNISAWKSVPALLNQRVCKIKADDKNIIDGFMYYLMKTKLKEIESETAFVTVKHLSAKVLNKVNVQLPSIADQQRIVAELDCLNEMIALKQEQLKEFDKLARSIFYDMFGDPITNSKNWSTIKLEKITKAEGGGTPSKGNPDYWDGDVVWVTSKDMKQMYISDSQIHITEEGLNNSSAHILPKGTILLVNRSGILKHTLPLAITTREVSINQDLKALTIKDKRFISIYILYALKAFAPYLLSKVKAVTVDSIEFSVFKNLDIPLAHLDLQQEFAEKIQAIEAQKELVKKSIAETQQLLDSRMDYYFD